MAYSLADNKYQAPLLQFYNIKSKSLARLTGSARLADHLQIQLAPHLMVGGVVPNLLDQLYID